MKQSNVHAGAGRQWRGAILLLAFWILPSALLPPSVQAAGSIFDDDWVPAPTHDAPPAAAPVEPASPPPAPATDTPQTTAPSPAPAAPPPAPQTPPVDASAPPIADSPKLLPVPAPTDQAKSRKLFKETFAADLKDGSPMGRKLLAGKLLGEADKMADNPCDRFVLLIGACHAAVEGIDLRLAINAAKTVASLYQVDALRLSVDTVLKTPLKPSTSAQAADAVEAGLEIDGELVQADDYASANRLLTTLQPLVNRSQSATLRARMQARVKELTESRAAFEQFQAAKRTLSTKADDPEANTVVGKYLWLRKDDAAGALQYLANGQNADLKALAKGDMAATTDADAAARGDAWSAYAAKQTGLMRLAADHRAAAYYRTAMTVAAGLGKLGLEKRAMQVKADATSYATAHGIHLGLDPATIQARRESIEKMPTKPLSRPFSGKTMLPPSVTPYMLGEEPVKVSGTLTIPAGTEIRGGRFELSGSGHIVAAGEKGKPVIFRHVSFGQDLGGSFKADGVIFDDCKFNKTGGWYATYSSKWTLTSCVLYQSRFGGFTQVDYGFQFHNCALVSMDLPEIRHPHDKNFTHPKVLHSEWNKIAGCLFVDCNVPPTVCWCADTSNFYGCTFAPGDPAEAFDSDKPYQDVAYISDTVGPSPDGVWASNPPKRAPVSLSIAADPFPTISLAGIDATIPEIIVGGDAGVSVVKPESK